LDGRAGRYNFAGFFPEGHGLRMRMALWQRRLRWRSEPDVGQSAKWRARTRERGYRALIEYESERVPGPARLQLRGPPAGPGGLGQRVDGSRVRGHAA